jgi:hypothetical protein
MSDGAEPKWPGEGLQSLYWLVQFQPAPPSFQRSPHRSLILSCESVTYFSRPCGTDSFFIDFPRISS